MDNSTWSTLLALGMGLVWTCVIIAVLSVVALWFIFDKAHEHGWAAIIPFYNDFVLFKITWGNGWLFLLSAVPAVIATLLSPSAEEIMAGATTGALPTILNLITTVVMIITAVKLAKSFGKGGGWACGLIFLDTIFLCIMAFDSKIQYVGVGGAPTEGPAPAAPAPDAAAPAPDAAAPVQSAPAETPNNDAPNNDAQ